MSSRCLSSVCGTGPVRLWSTNVCLELRSSRTSVTLYKSIIVERVLVTGDVTIVSVSSVFTEGAHKEVTWGAINFFVPQNLKCKTLDWRVKGECLFTVDRWELLFEPFYSVKDNHEVHWGRIWKFKDFINGLFIYLVIFHFFSLFSPQPLDGPRGDCQLQLFKNRYKAVNKFFGTKLWLSTFV